MAASPNSTAAARRLARELRKQRAERAHELWVQRQYGLAPGEYQAMLDRQDGRCAICMKQPRSKRLSVDHDHNTGKVRSLLCQPCNRAVGRFEFEQIVAEQAANYLLAIAADYKEPPP